MKRYRPEGRPLTDEEVEKTFQEILDVAENGSRVQISENGSFYVEPLEIILDDVPRAIKQHSTQ